MLLKNTFYLFIPRRHHLQLHLKIALIEQQSSLLALAHRFLLCTVRYIILIKRVVVHVCDQVRMH